MNQLQKLIFNKDICDGSISYRGKGDLVVQGKLKSNMPTSKLFFWAAAPPTYGTSFSGSGMPYPDPLTAYDRTPNKGVLEVLNGNFTINMKYPNAYYIGLGSVHVPPHINFKICEEGKEDAYFSIQIDDGVPFRMLTYPAPPTQKPRTSAMFYCEPGKGARTQESILRVSAYPSTNKMPDNFWGDRPPR